MRNLNVVAVDGNLTRDPESRLLESGKCLTWFGLAVNRGRDEVDFFEVKAWDGPAYRLAEICAENLIKGRRVLVRGRLRQERWTDRDEKQRSSVVIVADEVIFLDSPVRAERAPATVAAALPEPGSVMASRPQEPVIDPDDIPF